MKIDEAKFKEFVLDSRLVSRTDIERASADSLNYKRSLPNILVDKNYLSDKDMRRMSAQVLGIPFIELGNEQIDFDILSIIPEPISRTKNIVAYRKTSTGTEVLTLDVNSICEIDFIRKIEGVKILPRLTDLESIKIAILQYQKALKKKFGDSIKKEVDRLKYMDSESGDAFEEGSIESLADSASSIRVVETLIKHAIMQNASDIHVEPRDSEVLVRYRIDGSMYDAMVLPRNALPLINGRIMVLSGLKLSDSNLSKDGRFNIFSDGETSAVRFTTFPVLGGSKITMRLLEKNSSGFTLEKLGMEHKDIDVLQAVIRKNQGLFIVAGLPGSGRTTTAYTILDMLNNPRVSISTIEDKIEYNMLHANQTQARPDDGLTLASGMRQLLKRDSDIIMMSEIFDQETAHLSVNGALFGKLILSTIESKSAANVLYRLIDFGIDPLSIISSIRVIVGQRLVREINKDNCKKYFLKKGDINKLSKYVDLGKVMEILMQEKIIKEKTSWNKIILFKTSRKDKEKIESETAVFEVLLLSGAIKELLMRGASQGDIEVQIKKEGMLTIAENALIKAAKGLISIEEVFKC